MRKSKPHWGRIKRALKDPLQDFTCREQDLATPDGQVRHRDAFLSDEWVCYILALPTAGEVWLQVVAHPLPPATDWQSFLEQRRKAFYIVLLEALRLHWRQEKRRKRRARRIVSLDAAIGAEEGAISLYEALVVSHEPEPPLPPDLDALFDALTEREGQVALLLASGLTQAEIAAELGLTPGRVSQVVASLRRKIK